MLNRPTHVRPLANTPPVTWTRMRTRTRMRTNFGGRSTRMKMLYPYPGYCGVVQILRKFRVRVIPAGKYTPLGKEFDLKWRISSNLHMACSHWANVPEAIRYSQLCGHH